MDRKVKEIALWLRKGIVEVKGKVYYDEGAQSWSLIRLRKELIQQLPKLKEKRSRFSYKMVHYFTYEELLKAIMEMKQKGEPLPVLLYFCETMGQAD